MVWARLLRRMQSRKGWVVRVEHPEGDRLYVVATDEPLEAERIVRAQCAVPDGCDVWTMFAAKSAQLRAFALSPGELREST